MLRLIQSLILAAALAVLSGPALAAGGLYSERHAGTFSAVPDFSGLTSASTGVSTSLDGASDFDAAGAVRLFGDLIATQSGAYEFTITTGLAARIRVNGTTVAETTGGTGSGFIVLSAGRHAVDIAYLTPDGGTTVSATVRRPGETTEEGLASALVLPGTQPDTIDPQAAADSSVEDSATEGPRLGVTLAPSQAGALTPVAPRFETIAGITDDSGRSIREILARRAQSNSSMGLPDSLVSDSQRNGIRDAIGAFLLGSAFEMRLAQGDIAYVLVEGGTGSGTYRIGRAVPIAAAAAPTGYEFDEWIGGTLALADRTAAQTSLTVPSGGVSLRATYRLAVAAGEALLTVTNGTGTGVYPSGATVAIAANAAPSGEVFARWAGDTDRLANPFSASTSAVLSASEVSVGAVYRDSAQSSFIVSIIGGTGSGSYASGTSVAIAANAPPAGHTFAGWRGDTQLLSDPSATGGQITVPSADVRLEAVFTAPEAAVTVTNGTGSGSYAIGARVTVSANAAPAGQTFEAWTGDTASLTDASSPVTILTVPSSGAAITATYATSPITITTPVSGAQVDERGFTVAGTLANAGSVSALSATIRANGAEVVSGRQISFSRRTGRFALRVFDADAPTYSEVSVVITATMADSSTARARIGVRARPISSDILQLVNRITFGVTPALYDEVAEKGFDVFLAEQLNPASIDDRAFLATNPDAYFEMIGGDKINQLLRVKTAYALGTKRQLREVMASFWENHFYTSPSKEQDYLGELREMAAFRVNALGYFRDLLQLSARSSVMMSFLDNDDSVRGRLNENYARELMELHTVGVNGGYGNEDVIAVARILTGWRERGDGIERPDGHTNVREFYFDAAAHDTGDKFVPFLNHTFLGRSGEAGIEEGNEFLNMLAVHPSTAHFVCTKLVASFVNADPPADLIDQCQEDWLASSGHIGTVMTTILTSPHFHSSAQHYRSNFKMPLEYAMSVARAFDMRVGDEEDREWLYSAFATAIRESGQDMYQFPVPTGFSEEVGDWSGAASLVRRFRFGMDLARSQAPGTISWNFADFIENAPADTADGVAIRLFELATAGRFTQAEHEAVVDALYGSDNAFDPASDETQAMVRAMQLIVAMPSFQYQ